MASAIASNASNYDKYELLKVIGKGSFGTVHSCKRKLDNKSFVMKIINISELSEQAINESLHEVELLSSLNHPHIVRYYENFVNTQNQFCIVMENCTGGDLNKRIQHMIATDTYLTEEEALIWFVQIALALQHCHHNKVLHRDLKPSNVYITGSGVLKLGDFGISKSVASTNDLAHTVVGTPYSLSPELCKAQPYSYKSDIWGLGCLFYELLQLKRPFEGANLMGVVWNIVQESPAPLLDQYSSSMQSLLNSMLEKECSARPTIDELLDLPFLQHYITAVQSIAPLQFASTPSQSRIDVESPINKLSTTSSTSQSSLLQKVLSNTSITSNSPSLTSNNSPLPTRFRPEEETPNFNLQSVPILNKNLNAISTSVTSASSPSHATLRHITPRAFTSAQPKVSVTGLSNNAGSIKTPAKRMVAPSRDQIVGSTSDKSPGVSVMSGKLNTFNPMQSRALLNLNPTAIHTPPMGGGQLYGNNLSRVSFSDNSGNLGGHSYSVPSSPKAYDISPFSSITNVPSPTVRHHGTFNFNEKLSHPNVSNILISPISSPRNKAQLPPSHHEDELNLQSPLHINVNPSFVATVTIPSPDPSPTYIHYRVNAKVHSDPLDDKISNSNKCNSRNNSYHDLRDKMEPHHPLRSNLGLDISSALLNASTIISGGDDKRRLSGPASQQIISPTYNQRKGSFTNLPNAINFSNNTLQSKRPSNGNPIMNRPNTSTTPKSFSNRSSQNTPISAPISAYVDPDSILLDEEERKHDQLMRQALPSSSRH